MSRMAEMWTGVGPLGSSIASIMFIYTLIERYFPNRLRSYILNYVNRILAFTTNIRITVHEYTGDHLQRNVAYSAIEAYLSSKSTKDFKRLTAQLGRNSKKLVLTMDADESMIDEFRGAKLCWVATKTLRENKSSYSSSADVKRALTLVFHQRYRDMVTEVYLNHVMEKGMAILTRNRQRKLYTNCRYGYWSHVVLDHPATFDNIAMDPSKKKEIIEDLVAFGKGKQYYAKVGKAWKRGYLLYGPPGTGKSTMIAAIANFMNYDIYDLELTAVQGNSELRKLLLETSNKSVIVIEDIDCSLGLTRKRDIPKDKEEKDSKKGDKQPTTDQNVDNRVTLSGLLNFIDGLWSTCGRERLIVFTTNYKEKLDPALIRRGRMDKHIELSYCCFEGFKILAKNYLNLDSHHLFETLCPLFNETQITPADVAEMLMPKANDEDDAEICLKDLIRALEKRKADARLKAEEDAREKSLTKEGEAKQNESSSNGANEEDKSN
ncbi:hypothetical protein MKW94_029197 [Papaver nudicaule]|uniref:AAA+ ATPase domain-containing protein n=1 Tax=Papaver nudicaule TaxID=74823 RepID=A0AA41VGB8_PAPNU|nr:hypothetical protein [Papaver nudicaule]